jgi:TolB-like protein
MQEQVKIPGYRIVRELGRGGMGTVHLALQESLGREVALKLLTPQLVVDPIATERFMREGRVAARLAHRHIVSVYDVGVHAGQPFIAMEYMAGGAVVPGTALAPSQALEIVRQIALALDHAHSEGVIHRDLKPENILRRKDGSFALADFGIACALRSDGAANSTLTREGTTVGTPHYMSPEQLQAQPLDGRSDLYALGVVLFQLLTGQLPYQGTEDTPVGMQQVHAPLPRLPEDLNRYQSLIDALMAKSPAQRPASGAELARRIEEVQTSPNVAVLTQALPVAATSRGKVLALATALILALGTGGYIAMKHRSETAPQTRNPATSLASATATTAAANARSVAVLPLVNAGGDSDQQFFADGLSENLITTLSQFDGLKVMSRSASFGFRDSKDDARTIGTKLGVEYLISGSVRHTGNNVRINIELVRTADSVTVWTKRFDRSYKDIFATQDEIALAVAGAMQVKLLHAMPYMVESGRPASGNLEAYDAYLRAIYDSARNRPRSIEEFARATRLDPNYAQAWAWLAHHRTLYARDNLRADAARAAYAQARNEVETALRLEPKFGQAHAILAYLLTVGYHDWNGALAEFKIALSLVPETDPTHGAVSMLLTTLGKTNEAIAERRKYIAGDPLAAFPHMYLSDLQASLGRLGEAEASLREASRLAPERKDWQADQVAYLAILRNDAQKAIKISESRTPSYWRDRALALALQIGDDRDAANAALQRLLDNDGQAKDDAYAIARVYALRNDADKVFEWLRRDRERGGNGVLTVLADPLILRLRNDPRLAEYCRSAGLPAPADSEVLGIDQIRAALAVDSKS